MVAQNMDQQVLKKYDQTVEWMQKFSQPKDVIVSLIPKSSDIEFIQKNKQGIAELSELNKKLEGTISLEKNREIMKTLSENINKLNYVQSLLAINNKQADKDKEFEKMLEPLRQQIDAINNQIKEGYALIDDICNKAKELNSNKSATTQNTVKVIEDMTYNVTLINEIFDDFQQGSNFYNNLAHYLTNLQRIVADFSFARDIDKKNRLQELEAHKAYANFNKPQPFWSEQAGFHEGGSSFRPSNQSNTYQNLNQNLGTNPSVQQMPKNPQPQSIVVNMGSKPNQQPTVSIYGQHMFNPSQHLPTSNPSQHLPNQQNYVTSQVGYMQFGGPSQMQPQQGQNQNQGGMGFGSATSTFVADPFGKK